MPLERIVPAVGRIVAEVEIGRGLFMPPDWVNVPVPPLPTYCVVAVSEPPLMPETASLTVRLEFDPRVDVAAARKQQPVVQIDRAAAGGRDRALADDRVVDRAPAAEALAGRHT